MRTALSTRRPRPCCGPVTRSSTSSAASDDIEGFSLREKALIPGQVVWSPSAAREIGRVLGTFKPDVVHVHNLFPMISPSVLQACRRHLVPAVVTLHNYRQICPSGDLFRDGHICHDCVGRTPLASVRHGCYRDPPRRQRYPLAISNVATKATWQTLPSAYVFISDAQRQLFSSLDLPTDRCFVKHNLVYSMNGERATEPIDRLPRPAGRGQGRAPVDGGVGPLLAERA